MRTSRSLFTLGLLASGLTFGAVAAPPRHVLQAVPFTRVHLEPGFWAERVELNRTHVVPHTLKYCEDTGRIRNFAKAAGLMPGPFEGIYFNDSDVYKVLEGAAYTLAQSPDPKLEARVDEIIDLIAAAQQPDGYLYTFYTVNRTLDKRWTDMGKHELYCAGHLIEAAVAYYQATKKRKLLDVAIRLADYIDSVFGPDKRHDVPGHEEIELALVKLWRLTGQDRYLKLAEFFVGERGHRCGRRLQGEYSQDHVPVAEQRRIVGHAVRAMYLYSAVADLAAIHEHPDYLETLDAIWHDVVQRKMYITGGIGPSRHNEGFTVEYDLPNDTAYAETCASIGMAFWNQRLALLHADGRYADVVERVMYNGALSGVSLDGEKFFYVNPLGSRGQHHRQPWFGCACCPVNIVRFLPTIGGYAYAHDDRDIYINQYVAGRAEVTLPTQTVKLNVQTRYPWEGEVRITVEPEKEADFGLYLRVPGWCQGTISPDDLYRFDDLPAHGAAQVEVNGKALADVPVVRGYARVQRRWKAGDRVELTLPMPVRRVHAHPNVKADRGRVALQRGPIVYCLEGVDNEGTPRSLVLPATARLRAAFKPDLLGGVTVVTGTALRRLAGDRPPESVRFTAIPYYAWDNREPGQMVVWLPENPKGAEPRPVPTAASRSRASASHTWASDTVHALNDQIEPADSNDHSIPRFTWWDHRGTREWVQYDFPKPTQVRGVEVYWFDDTGRGSCRVPASWRVLYRANGRWRPVEGATSFPVQKDRFNRVTFTRVTTDALRLEVQLQPGYSGGILEWRVLE